MFEFPAIILTAAAAALATASPARAASGDQEGRTTANVGDVQDTGVDGYAYAAPYHDAGASNGGRVTVVSWNGFAYISRVINGAIPGDRFGWSVDGSQGRIIIGTPYNDDRGSNAGRVWVYEWNPVTQDFDLWKTFRGSRGDRFGWAVATGIDVNHDGRDDFLIGAPYEDKSGKSNRGAVHVISGRTGREIETVYGEHRSDLFGWSVAGVGRADSDSRDDFIVGAPRNDDRASNAGKAYVFSGKTFDPIYAIKGSQKGGQLGRAVAGIGRADTDSYDDVAVGAPYYDRGSRTNAGRVIVYSSRNAKRLWVKYGRRKNDWLGWSVAGAFDVDCDGYDDVLIGAPRYDYVGFTDTGRVYVRSGRDGVHLESLFLSGVRQQDGPRFGFSAAALGDFQGSSAVRFLVGAPLLDIGARANEGELTATLSSFNCGPGPGGFPALDGVDENVLTSGIAVRIDDGESATGEFDTASDDAVIERAEPHDDMDDMDDMDDPDAESALDEEFTVEDVLEMLEARSNEADE